MSPKVVTPSVEETLALLAGRVRHLESLEPITPRARVYRSNNQLIGNGVWPPTAISFDSERFDTDNIWVIGTPTRLICPMAGTYLSVGNIGWWNDAGGRRLTAIYLNAATELARHEIGSVPDGNTYPAQVVSTIYELAVGDSLELCVYQNSGGAINVVRTANFSPEFMMARLG